MARRVAAVRPRMRSLPLSKVYQLLEPGPVVLLTTYADGKPNAMPMSWHTMMEFEPPLVGCVISNRNHSYEAVARTRQCAINIPTVELARQVVRCGNTTGRNVDKFRRFGLTALPARDVAAPLVGECYACLECRVVDTRMVARYGFFVLEIVKAWIDPSRRNPRTIHHRGRGRFAVSGRTFTLPSSKK